MPISIDIYDLQCFNQLRNGENFNQNLSDFTRNIVGNVGEKVKIKYFARLMQSSFAEEGIEEWDIYPDRNEIVRSSGSFISDGVQVGDQYRFYDDWKDRPVVSPPTEEYQATVTFVSSDGTRLNYEVTSGSDTTSGTVSNVGMEFPQNNSGIYPNNINTALFLKFGLIENDETFNYQSKVTESTQVYYTSGMTVNVVTESESLGSIKDWVTGEATGELWAIEPDEPTSSATYQITQEFIITPFYTLAIREFINNGTIPEVLAGDSSLKYVSELEFRKNLTDTGSAKIQSFDGLGGFVGWYGENFNGLNSKYEIKSIVYTEQSTSDEIEAVNINSPTRATIVVENINDDITDFSCGIYLIRLPDSEDDYIGTKTNMVENFLYKSEIISSPDTSSDNATASIVNGDLVIDYDIEYSVAERLRLTTDDEYMIMVQIENPLLSSGNSDRVMLIADLKNFTDVNYVDDFINIYKYNFLSHGKELNVSDGDASPVVSSEDGILLDASIGVNTARNVSINSISVSLISYNQSEGSGFNLDSYEFSLGDITTVNGVQQIEVETTRGYTLDSEDDFNLVKVSTEGEAVDDQLYSIIFGQKIKWQDWILNNNVDPVFFDNSKTNNNLNYNSSNYSAKEGYNVYLAVTINVTGVDDLDRVVTGDYVHYGGVISVKNYDESEDGVTGYIQTFDLETGNSLDGAILYNGKDTLFKAVFENAEEMQYAIHRIEPSQNIGDGIQEMSSLYLNDSNSLLKPITGEDRLKFDLSGSTLETSCLINGDNIQEGVPYKLSARTGRYEEPYDFGLALSFDTFNDAVNMTNSFAPNDPIPDSFSLTSWVNVRQHTGARNDWLFFNIDSPLYPMFRFGISSVSGTFNGIGTPVPGVNYFLSAQWGTSGTLRFTSLSELIDQDDDWHNVCFTFDRDGASTATITAYWDSVPLQSVQISTSDFPSVFSQNTYIGYTSLGLSAKINEWAFVDSILTQQDISSIYANGLGSSYLQDNISSRLYLKFNKSGAVGGGDNTALSNSCVDSSGNGQDATAENIAKIGVISNWVDH